jgi:uncharacterized protein (UPF0548 family)
VRPGDASAVARLLASLPGAELTYAESGATLTGSAPMGFRHDRYAAELGRGQPVFERAVAGVQTWRTHRVLGVRVFPDTERIVPGTHVVVTLGSSVLALAAPCRVVGVVDESDRWGFAYGTLPGHPEQGEEAFVVSMAADETVQLEIVALSRPGAALVRLAGPVGPLVQRAATKAYLRALRAFVQGADGTTRQR